MTRMIIVIIIIIVILIIIPIGINHILMQPWPLTAHDITNADWLLFWGSYIGAMATLFAFFLTTKHNARMIKNEQEDNKENIQLLINNMSRPYLDYMCENISNPASHKKIKKCYINCPEKTFYESPNEELNINITKKFNLCNIGNSVLKDLKLTIKIAANEAEGIKLADIYYMYPKDEQYLIIAFGNIEFDVVIKLEFTYQNILGNNYMQFFDIKINNSLIVLDNMSIPKRIIL